jgi:hypothetical protein
MEDDIFWPNKYANVLFGCLVGIGLADTVNIPLPQ